MTEKKLQKDQGLENMVELTKTQLEVLANESSTKEEFFKGINKVIEKLTIESLKQKGIWRLAEIFATSIAFSEVKPFIEKFEKETTKE